MISNKDMSNILSALTEKWRNNLNSQLGKISEVDRESILQWLFGEDTQRWETLPPQQIEIIEQGIDYRYRILQQRYLNVSPTQAYRQLINRLGSLVLLRNKIRTWVSLSRDRQRAVTDVLEEVIQEMLNSDRNIQQQLQWISHCTSSRTLRNSLLLTSIEEYSLRPIRNQPLLVYRFVNYLRRTQRGGMTHVPQAEMIRLVSEEFNTDEADSPVSLLDNQALVQYQEDQDWENQQVMRVTVQQEFAEYLLQEVGETAKQWLDLYLQGKTQESIAQTLGVPIKQIYRLREKVSYHAIRVFALKEKPELVANWLEISLKDHNLGLTPQQWTTFYEELTPEQKSLLTALKQGENKESIAKQLNWKVNQVLGEWSKMYLSAQTLRNMSLTSRS